MKALEVNNNLDHQLVRRKSSITTPKRLGKLLLEKELISQEQLDTALLQQKISGEKLGATLVALNFLSAEELASAFAEQLHLPMINVRTFLFDDNITKLLSQVHARRLQAVALEEKGDALLVTVADPFDLIVYDELVRILKRDVLLAVSPADDIKIALDKIYRKTDEITGLVKQLERDVGNNFDFQLQGILEGENDAPVVRLVQTVFEDAVQVNASDIHIEPMEDVVLVRFRIDGVLHIQTRVDKSAAGAIAQRLKLMSGLDISERRLPQDGRFNMQVGKKPLDVRISTLPSQYGESVVMRLLRQNIKISGLASIGMPLPIFNRVQKMLDQTNGMLLVTGPTGSGKSTTLYSALGALDRNTLKVLTVEDPIEYRLGGIIQTQVNDKIELSFAKVLRAALRQDPDVILVGEIRDQETADIAMRAAITGHMVLSTLHTKDAASTPLRLFDMGIPPYMVATSLQTVIAQRLLRTNCEYCCEEMAATPALKAWLSSVIGKSAAAHAVHKVGKGCPSCNHSGYTGRTGVYEMFEMDNDLIELAAMHNLAQFSKTAYLKMENKTLLHHAIELVLAGKTTFFEAQKVSQQLDHL